MSKSKKSGKSSKTSKISKINYPYSNDWDVKKLHVTFEIEKLPLSIANSIRRTILSDVKTFAARSMPYKQSTIEIIKNDSPLTAQIIQHRISLIPLNITNEDFPIDDYEFIINITHKENKFRKITTNDIQVKDLKDGSFLPKNEASKFFFKHPLLKTDIIITKLKPVYTNNNPSIFESNTNALNFHVTFKAVLQSGSDNSCHMPQSAISCFFKENPELVEKARIEYIKKETEKFNKNELTPISKEELTKIFDTSFKQRHYYENEQGEPNHFVFLIESIGVIPPLVIFHRGCRELITRINNFELNLKSNNTNIINVKPSSNVINGFEIIVESEDDTLGNIIQEHISNKYCNDEQDDIVDFISYKRTHPLENTILFNISSSKYKNIDNLIESVFVPSCQSIVRKIKLLQSNLEETSDYIREIKLCK